MSAAGVFRIGASLLTAAFAHMYLDSKLKKNQSPVLIRLAGFRSQPLFPIFFNRTNNLTFRLHPPPFTMKAKDP